MKSIISLKMFNLIGLIFICVILGITIYLQVGLLQEPCPLCLLQRLGMIGIGIGFAMNIRFGENPKFYALSLLSAIYGAAVAIRQIILHIVPGSPTYGEPIFGLYLYTWSFLGFVGMMLYIILLLAVTQTEATQSKN